MFALPEPGVKTLNGLRSSHWEDQYLGVEHRRPSQCAKSTWISSRYDHTTSGARHRGDERKAAPVAHRQHCASATLCLHVENASGRMRVTAAEEFCLPRSGIVGRFVQQASQSRDPRFLNSRTCSRRHHGGTIPSRRTRPLRRWPDRRSHLRVPVRAWHRGRRSGSRFG